MNLPQFITKGSTGEVLNYTYDALGNKLRKQIGGQITDYLHGIHYTGNTIDFILTEEGRAIPGTSFTYEYFLKDHLGNNRATIKQDGSIVQVQDYYPFGLEMNTGNNLSPSPQNNYKYNNKEKQNELGLDQLDYKARFYDSFIGRFGGIDRLADTYVYKSPYDYAENRPVNGVDLDGLEWSSTIDAQGKGMISVNIKFSFFFPESSIPGFKVVDYQRAINETFNTMLSKSSNERISGSVTFKGGVQTTQVIPSLILSANPPEAGRVFTNGMTGPGYSVVDIYNPKGLIATPLEFSIVAVHELLHTLY